MSRTAAAEQCCFLGDGKCVFRFILKGSVKLYGLQAHFFKVFGHAKFQLSITSTFKVIKLLVNVTKYLH